MTEERSERRGRAGTRPSLRSDEAGVSNVVTTIMMISIFLIIFSAAWGLYTPVIQKDAEREHLQTVEGQFMQLKENIDAVILRNQANLTLTSRITLGAEGGPFFGLSATSGALSIDPDESPLLINRSGDPYDIYARGKGSIQFDSDAYEYVDQTFTYEYGAVIMDQGREGIMTSEPHFTVEKGSASGADYSILRSTFITLTGGRHYVSGTGEETVSARLVVFTPNVYTFSAGARPNIQINITTQYPSTWVRYFNDTLSQVLPASMYSITQVSHPTAHRTSYVLLELREVGAMTLNVAVVEMRVS